MSEWSDLVKLQWNLSVLVKWSATLVHSTKMSVGFECDFSEVECTQDRSLEDVREATERTVVECWGAAMSTIRSERANGYPG